MFTRVALLFATVASVALSPPLGAQTLDQHVVAQIDALFSQWDRDDWPGAAMGVVRDGRLVYHRGYGSANLEHHVPITSRTVFDIASVSKQFGAFSIALLAERGHLDLDADIRTYLPEMPDFGSVITVRHLVHHTSGLRDWPGTLGIAGWRMDDVISFDQILTMARHQRTLNFEPGAEYSYSNTGYNVLAAIVERVSGQSFREWTDANIFAPLGMRDTHFQDDHTEIVPNRAQGYQATETGFRNVHNGLTALASSSLFTTVEDLARWAANFDDGRVGGPAVIRQMEDRFTLNDGERIAYTYGQSIGTYRGATTWTHSGSWAGFRTVLLRIPEHRFAVIVLSNLGDFNPGARAREITDIVLGAQLDPAPAVTTATEREGTGVRVSTSLLDAYAGTYKLGAGWLVTISRAGAGLMTQATAEDRFPMRAMSDSVFWVDAYGADMTFKRNGRGEVDRLEYQGITAPRIHPVEPTDPRLDDYVGEYESAELSTSYVVRVEDGTLVARHRRTGPIELRPLAVDEFRGSAWFFTGVEFERDATGRVTDMFVSNGRSRRVRFVRLR